MMTPFWQRCLLHLFPYAATLSAILPLGSPGVAAPTTARPNVLFILADDLGWRDTTVYGSTFYRTPNVERLARRGMKFVNAYSANPLCSPTRASILTGLYPARLRLTTPAGHLKEVVLNPILPEKESPTRKAVTPQTRTRLPLEYYTLAEALHDAGYRTAHFGKWHLGWEPYDPRHQGFDVNLPGGSYPGPRSYFSPYKMEGFKDGPPGEHIDDRMAAEAVKFLRENKDRPFFLNYWMFSVHAPFQAKTNLVEKYRKLVDPANPQRNPVMGAMVEAMDTALGRVLDAVDELGLSDKTLIIFTSDNGGNMYNVVEGLPPTNNQPLRSGKGTIYEGGHRVPLIVIWPGQVKPASQSEAFVSSVDYYPTILDLLGLKPQANQRFDGVSFVPALRQTGSSPRDTVPCHFPHYVLGDNPPATSVRQGDWKLIRLFADNADQTDRFELYNLKADLGETNNLAGQFPDRVQHLNAIIAGFLKGTDALAPKPNPAYDPASIPVTAGGWTGNKFARPALEAGRLVIKSTGGDPSLTTRDVPQVAGPFIVELRMKSDSKGQGQLFWSVGTKQPFHRDRSVIFPVNHDGQWHNYTLNLPVGNIVQSLRLDPSMASGRIEIELIQFKDVQGRLVKQWDFKP